jgi:NAD(P)-dependent dehydrogenase (short-subunit alcohol dehydrogenase family)
MRGLKGKRIVVASGATGIGAATAERLAAEGSQLIVGDINEAGLAETVERIKQAGGRAHAAHYDLADAGSIAALIEASITRYGGIDGLANIGADVGTTTLQNDFDVGAMDVAIWERTLRVNLIGHALLMKAALPHFIAQGGGAIVSVSSASAYMGDASLPAYAASKAGLHALIRHVARRWGKDNVRCNGVAPGLVLTGPARGAFTPAELARNLEQLPLPRHGEPADLAATIAFLLSDDAEWITGQVIATNGGIAFRD